MFTRFRRTIHDRDNAMLLIFWDDLHWKISPFLNEFVTSYCEKNKVIGISDQSMFVEKRKIKITSMNGNVFRIWGMVYTNKKALKVWNINQLKPSSEPGSKKIYVSSVVSSVISESNVSNGEVIPPSLNVFNCSSPKMTKYWKVNQGLCKMTLGRLCVT